MGTSPSCELITEILTVFYQLYTFKLCTDTSEIFYFKIYSTSLGGLSVVCCPKRNWNRAWHAVYMVGRILLDMVGMIFQYGISLNIVYNESSYKNKNKLEYPFFHCVQEKI